MLRLRTGQTLEQIAFGLKVSIPTIHNRLQNARKILYKYFVCSSLKFSWTRKELNDNTIELSRLVHGNGDPDQVILVLDGTYIYTEKSGNQDFQKQSYINQKKRNFVKIMMCVTTNGKIIFASGPHAATKNDATILRNILDRNECNVFSILKPGDVILVDRGFRDCSELLKARGLDVRSPAFLNKKSDGKLEKQLTTKQANETRLVTKFRYVVEARNGHMKCIWRLFKLTWTTKALPHLMEDYRIGAALVNKFFENLVADKEMTSDVATRMLMRLNEPNTLAKIVGNDSFQKNMKHFL